MDQTRTEVLEDPETKDIVVVCAEHGEIARVSSLTVFPWTAAQTIERSHRWDSHRVRATL